MTYAIIENGTVANIVEASPDFAKSQGWVPLPEGAAIGWLYDGETFKAPPIPIASVPEAVTMRQARIALSRAGVLKAAEDAIAAMPGQAGEEARIEWDYAAELRRDHPLVTGLGDTLGLDAGAVDDLFRSAASI